MCVYLYIHNTYTQYTHTYIVYTKTFILNVIKNFNIRCNILMLNLLLSLF